jgi:DNA invertase Pin-like site-specific DNA recombinase
VGEIVEELDKSGMRASNRSLLLRTVDRIESGASNGLVVARLSRFGRSFEDGVQLIGRIKRAGGTLISVREGFDLSTPTGRLVFNILISVAAWESEAKGEYAGDSNRNRIDRGITCGVAPIGYRKTKAGRLKVDQVAGPVIAEVFRRRAADEIVQRLVEFLNESVVETRSGVPFTWSHLGLILKNPAYKGTARAGAYENARAHEPLVEPDQWALCQAKPRASRRATEVLLTGHIRCANCGELMFPVTSRGRTALSNHYSCRGSNRGRRYDCSAPARAQTEELDALVEEFIFVHGKAGGSAGSDRQVTDAEVAVEKAERDLAAYRDNVSVAHTLGPLRFEEGIDTRMHLLERKLLQLARVKRAKQAPQIDPEALEAEWPELHWDQRRSVVRDALDMIVVERGASPVIERAWVFRKGRGPALMKGETLDFPRWQKRAARFHEHRLWKEERIEGELREFFLGRDPRWPNYLEFAKAGRGRLHAQVLEWGGPYYWGQRLGLEVPAGVIRWSQPKIRGALRPLLEDRENWPSKREFLEAGLGALHAAVGYHGGHRFWADQFDVRYEHSGGPKWLKWSHWRIEHELRALLDGRNEFPFAKELEEAGPGLYQAIRRNGGMSYWAERFEVSLSYGRTSADLGGQVAKPSSPSHQRR